MSIMDLAESRDKAGKALYPASERDAEPITIPIYHYEKIRNEFKPGEVHKNFNGHVYKFIERYKNDRYLMLRPDTGMYLVAYNPASYVRNPIDEPFNKQYGLEWDSAKYLSSRFADVDMDMLREQYGEYQEETPLFIPFHSEMAEERVR